MPNFGNIVEIIKQAEQGLSSPFLCRSDDGGLYFVKGRASGRPSLWAEWLGGHLGRAFGLPIPPFCIVDVPAALIRECPPELRVLGSGPAFASRLAEGSQWLELATAPRVSLALQRDILVFDWWLRNGDRTRGNPNLLWNAGQGELVVIDHNQAFDAGLSSNDFWEHHIFAGQRQAVFGDLAEQARYGPRLEAALSVWQEACDNVPSEWLWENDEHDVPAAFDPDAAHALAARCSTPDFWRTE
ncbi:MAG: HipA family kinase [Azonexus sp.]